MTLATLRKRIPLFAGLHASDFEQLEKKLARRRYAAGQVLFHMGDEGGSLHIVDRGRVKVTIPASTGEELIVALLSEGEMLGELSLFDGKPRTATVEAIEDTETLCLHRDDLLALMQGRFPVVVTILEVLARRLRNTDALLAESHFLDIRTRLARKIVALARSFGVREGARIRVDVRITQRELASMIGATRESTNKQLKNLRDQRLVSYEDGTLEVLDLERLAQKARVPANG